MKQLGFRYEVSVRLSFTAGEVARLISLAESHYDGRCKAAAQPGGVLYGLRNRVHLVPERDAEATLGSDDLETLNKITEVHGGRGDADLCIVIMQAIKASVAEWQRVLASSPPQR